MSAVVPSATRATATTAGDTSNNNSNSMQTLIDDDEQDNDVLGYSYLDSSDDPPNESSSSSSTSALAVLPPLALRAPARALLALLQPLAATYRLARFAQDEANYFAHLGYDMGRHFVDSLIVHATDGPPRKSWSFAFHVMTRMIRANIFFPKHTMDRIRRPERLFSGLLPAPLDIKITPFAFTVNKGLLLRAERESAAWWGEGVGEKSHIVPAEIGGAAFVEITGEWVECTNSPAYKARAKAGWSSWLTGEEPETEDEPIILYLHGGAYSMLSAQSHRSLISRIARETGARVFAINYRLAPENPFPAAIHDAFAAWLYLTEPDHPAISPNPRHLFRPENITVMGDSAGGGLSAALMLYLKDFLRGEDGAPRFGLPGAAVLLSPWVDLTCTQPSWTTNAHVDYLPTGVGDIFEPMYADDGPNPVAGYLWGTKPDPDRRYRSERKAEEGDPFEKLELKPDWKVERRVYDQVTHPLISPLYGNLRGLPPVLIQAGDSEVLRDETILFAKKYSEANRHRRGSFAPGMTHPDPVIHNSTHGHVRHELYKDQVHVFQAFLFLHSAGIAVQNIGRFHRSIFSNSVEFDEDEAVLTVTSLGAQEGDVMVTVADVDNAEILSGGKTGDQLAKEIGDGEMEMAREALEEAEERYRTDRGEDGGELEGKLLGLSSWLPSFLGGPATGGVDFGGAVA